ncbi:MAG: DUF6499 domain-containing protein [Amaricoccus sp.]|uniref:transcriptional regulator domain-containing protein n=1 Tax=Amaricoccus sp. TaxID=1872485 RepID=UPI00331555F8
MRPNASYWRERERYDYFDGLSVEGLAWECLRRNEDYQRDYRALVDREEQDQPLTDAAQRRWGLRFRGEAGALRPGAGGLLDPRRRSRRAGAHRRAGAVRDTRLSAAVSQRIT